MDLPALRKQLEVALRGINRGLAIDADLPVLTSAEAQVEDILDILENNNPTPVPTKNPLMPGKWALIYTSSSITRYFGGVTGVQRLLPEGIVGEIYQIIDPEDGTSRFEEMVQWEIPMLGKAVDSVVVADGKIRATSEVRQMWEPMSVKSGFWSWFADNWKTLRAFQVADTTYLDDELRITRGQTGSVNVFRRV